MLTFLMKGLMISLLLISFDINLPNIIGYSIKKMNIISNNKPAAIVLFLSLTTVTVYMVY